MNHEDRNQMTDRLLDTALARYSDAEPRNGLEQRILANLAEHTTKRAPVWTRLLWASAACVAALALVAGISLLHHDKRPANPTRARVVTSPVPAQAQEPRLAAANSQTAQKPPRTRTRAPRVLQTTASSPRQPQFPAPAPPTEQELLLIAYLNVTPTHELLAVAADQQQWRERVQSNARVIEEDSAPAREVNDLRNSPPESGFTNTGASGARKETP